MALTTRQSVASKMASQQKAGEAGTMPAQTSSPSTERYDYNIGLNDNDNPWANSNSDYWIGLNATNPKDNALAYDRWMYNSNSEDAKRMRNMQTPTTQLRFRLNEDAKSFRDNLGAEKLNQQGLLRRDADMAADAGTRNVRKGANDRGLLYSGLRESGEQGVRSRVSSLLARQIADSNTELDKAADARDLTAANVGLQNYERMLQQQEETDRIRQQNSIARSQQMQQFAQVGGYMAGQGVGSRGNSSEIKSQRIGNGQYMTNQVVP